MKKKIINIRGLSINNYKRDENSYDLHIMLEINDQKKILAKRYSYGGVEAIVADVIEVIKRKFRNENIFDDDPFNHTLIMQNLEDVEDKMIGFIKRVHDKIRDFKSHKSHTNYMNLYNSIDGLKIEF